MLSLLQYDKGDIRIFGKEMAPDQYDIKKDIGVVMQNVAVFEQMTVFENIDYFCGLYINDKNKRKKMVEDAISFVGLEDYKKMKPKKLSGGLLRRLNIACGIAHRPKLILLDEPTVAVDPQSRNNILTGIQELNRQGSTIIYTSHYMEEVEQICTKIAILDHGRVIAQGTKDELKKLIKTSEIITIADVDISQEQMNEIRRMNHVFFVEYEHSELKIRCSGGNQNLVEVLHYLQEREILLLKSGDIKGIYYNEKKLQLTVTSNGMEQSRKVVKNVSLGGKTYDEFLQYYFALIAMACMFGAFLGMANSMDMQANITQLAARRCIAPVHRIKMIISDMVVVFFMHFINVCVLLLYLRFILKIEIGNQWPQMILVAFIGSMLGVSLGTFIGVSLLCSFLAGLMVGGMKNIIDQYIPIVNRLNPAALIADAFYSMSVYADPSRFITDILFMTAISGVFIIITFLLIRRERYDSI